MNWWLFGSIATLAVLAVAVTAGLAWMAEHQKQEDEDGQGTE